MKHDYLNVICLLTLRLPKSQQIHVLAEALTRINPMRDDFFHDVVVKSIFDVLHKTLLEKINVLDQKDNSIDTWTAHKNNPEYQTLQKLAAYSTNNYKKTAWYERLAPEIVLYLPEDKQKIATANMLQVARKLKKGKDRVYALCTSVQLLPESERKAVFEDALRSARAIKNVDDRISSLQYLAWCVPENEREEILKEGLTTMLAIPEGYKRVPILRMFAPHLKGNLLEDALPVARTIADRYWCATAIYEFALYLRGEDKDIVIDEALQVVRTIDDMYHRATILNKLIPHLPKHERAKVIEEALTAAHSIENKFHCSRVLGEIASNLPDTKREKVLKEAMIAVCAIENKRDRASSLYNLAPYLTENLLREAVSVARTIEDKMDRADVLCKLAPLLPENILGEALASVYEVKGVRYSVDLAYILGDLAPHLSENERLKVFVEALTSADAIGHVSHRAKAIHYLISHLTDWALQRSPRPFFVFTESLQVFSKRPRPEFLQDLAMFMPFILALAGDEAPQAAEGIYQAIQEVCGWWP